MISIKWYDAVESFASLRTKDLEIHKTRVKHRMRERQGGRRGRMYGEERRRPRSELEWGQNLHSGVKYELQDLSAES